MACRQRLPTVLARRGRRRAAGAASRAPCRGVPPLARHRSVSMDRRRLPTCLGFHRIVPALRRAHRGVPAPARRRSVPVHGTNLAAWPGFSRTAQVGRGTHRRVPPSRRRRGVLVFRGCGREVPVSRRCVRYLAPRTPQAPDHAGGGPPHLIRRRSSRARPEDPTGLPARPGCRGPPSRPAAFPVGRPAAARSARRRSPTANRSAPTGPAASATGAARPGAGSSELPRSRCPDGRPAGPDRPAWVRPTRVPAVSGRPAVHEAVSQPPRRRNGAGGIRHRLRRPALMPPAVGLPA